MCAIHNDISKFLLLSPKIQPIPHLFPFPPQFVQMHKSFSNEKKRKPLQQEGSRLYPQRNESSDTRSPNRDGFIKEWFSLGEMEIILTDIANFFSA